jgi:putative membrane protein
MFPKILFYLYLLAFILLGLSPFDRQVWVAENLPIVLIVVVLAVLYKKGVKFSNISYVLMSVLVFLHTVGGHFTFERVPFDWFTNFFGFERNHYDRIAHFSVGFYAYPIAEYLYQKMQVRSRWLLFLFPVCAIFTVAAAYEIIEWWFAAGSNPEAGTAFLGSQGDIWDAQKDMLADGLGGIVAAGAFLLRVKK